MVEPSVIIASERGAEYASTISSPTIWGCATECKGSRRYRAARPAYNRIVLIIVTDANLHSRRLHVSRNACDRTYTPLVGAFIRRSLSSRGEDFNSGD